MAMQLTDDVAWTTVDFVVAGALLTIIGVALELAVKRAGTRGIAVCSDVERPAAL